MLARALILLIRVYQITISPLLGPVCRFEPSCSRYAAACLANHGALKGSWLALLRLLRCHPFNPGGYDPPPPARGREEGVALGRESGNDTAPASAASLPTGSPPPAAGLDPRANALE